MTKPCTPACKTGITWTSAFAQGESESLSNNVKWGKRKGFAQGKYPFPYQSMLGYRKGPDGQPEIVPEEAEQIRLIFRLFLLGRSLRQIKEALERRNILTPKGNREWSLSTIENILRNEKYMGDALLQKSYTADFLTKKKKKNHGELTQYYITDDHPPIIGREDFLNAQLELTRRASKKNASQKKAKSPLGKYCSKYALSERLVCGECTAGSSGPGKMVKSRCGAVSTVWNMGPNTANTLPPCRRRPSTRPSLPASNRWQGTGRRFSKACVRCGTICFSSPANHKAHHPSKARLTGSRRRWQPW